MENKTKIIPSIGVDTPEGTGKAVFVVSVTESGDYYVGVEKSLAPEDLMTHFCMLAVEVALVMKENCAIDSHDENYNDKANEATWELMESTLGIAKEVFTGKKCSERVLQ